METPRRERDAGGTPTPTRDHSTLLREQEAERERLRMDNFNQALRINFLEERLLRVKQGTDFAGEDLESELAQLRITLEERDHELRQRNFSMIRATEAIDLLTAQLHEAQAAAARAREEAQRDAEAQLQHIQRGVDAETAEKWRQELEMANQEQQQSARRIQELEMQIQTGRGELETLREQAKELQQQRERERRDVEMKVQRDQQSLQQLELNNVKLSTEMEHWKALATQREEQLATLQLQMESMRQEKQKTDARAQAKLKSMEEQVQHQMEQLQRESENYRAEHTRLLTDREKTHFDKERLAMENESIKQERARLQAEMERVTKEMQQVAGDAKRAQLQNAKLTATCEEQGKSLETLKRDREGAMDSIHQLESEMHQSRKLVSEYELTIKTLESRLQYAEAEAQRMKEQCDLAESRCQQTSNERLLVLEKDRQAIEEDNRRLRSELAGFQQDLEAMERKVQESEERFSNEAAHANEQRQHLSAYEKELHQQETKTLEYQNQLAACEDELARRSARIQELELQLTEAASASSSATTAVRQQQTEWQHQAAAEKSDLLRQLESERRRALELEHEVSALKEESRAAQRELASVEAELRSLLSSRSLSFSGNKTVASLVREAVFTLKSEFKNEVENIQARWKQQSSLMGSKLDRLTTQLRSSEGKLDVLQRSSFHAKDSKQSQDKTWSVRYEELRAEKEHERRELEEEIRYFQTKSADAEDALARAKAKLEALAREQRSHKSSHRDSQQEYDDLRESNRLLHEEVQERRRSAEHARKQYMQAVRENKELLKAIEIYKDGIAKRDKDLERHKAKLIKYSQQLQQRTNFGDVKQTLLEQLEQTQYMISETYKRWEDSPIVRGPGGSRQAESLEAAIVQLDEYVGRLHLVSERWGEFMTQSQELQRRYGEAWKAASTRGFDRSKEQPRWVQDVERKCSRLLAEAVRISEAMHDVANSIANVLQRERDEKKRLEKERAIAEDNNASVKRREDGDYPPRSRTASQPQCASPVKTRVPNGRRSASELYRSSLSSLGRVGMKVQDLDKEIRRAHD